MAFNIKISFCCLCLMLGFSNLHASHLFRYQDDAGNTVINHRLPAKYAVRGYDIIKPNGQLIKRVAQQLTEQEQQQLAAQANAKAKLKAEQQSQEAYDLSLLKKFSFVSDIEAEEKRKINELNVRVSILKGNLSNLQNEVDQAYEVAAQREKKGLKLLEKQKNRIQTLERQIISTEALLIKHLDDIESVKADYNEMKNRFDQLLMIKNQLQTQNL